MSKVFKNEFIQIKKWGNPTSPEVISDVITEDIDTSKLGEDKFVVEMKYASIHPPDINTITASSFFQYSVVHNITPTKFGTEGVGIVVYKGQQVTAVEVGDIVSPSFDIPTEMFTCYQKYVVCSRIWTKVQPDIPLEIGAQIAINPFTAIGLLDDFGLFEGDNSKKGWLVQNGANGTVGRMVHSICKQIGVKSIALVRYEDAIPMMKELGATKVVVTGNIKTVEEYSKAIKDATDGEGATYAIECVGQKTASLGMYEGMAKNGSMTVYGCICGDLFKFDGLPNPQNVNQMFFFLGNWFPKKQPEEV